MISPGLRLGLAGAVTLCLSAISASVQAANWTDSTVVSGFMSAVYSRTNEGIPFNGGAAEAGINKDGSFQGTRYGVNIRSQVTDKVNFASQLFASQEGEQFNIVLDWAFAGIKLGDDVTLRAGKIKYPIGLVNEYVDVGVAYPWIRAPLSIYSDSAEGPSATDESYSGFSLLTEKLSGDWTYSADLFAGQVDVEGTEIGYLKKLAGLSLRADWNDMLQLHAAASRSEMQALEGVTSEMDGEKKSTALLGVKAEVDNVVVYAEGSKATLGVAGGKDVTTNSAYLTVGYRLGNFLPHVTYQTWERKAEAETNGNDITTLGVRYDMNPSTALKLEVSNIKTDGNGLFEPDPGEEVSGSTRLVSVSVDVVF